MAYPLWSLINERKSLILNSGFSWLQVLQMTKITAIFGEKKLITDCKCSISTRPTTYMTIMTIYTVATFVKPEIMWLFLWAWSVIYVNIPLGMVSHMPGVHSTRKHNHRSRDGDLSQIFTTLEMENSIARWILRVEKCSNSERYRGRDDFSDWLFSNQGWVMTSWVEYTYKGLYSFFRAMGNFK